jgi:hypothetical protein
MLKISYGDAKVKLVDYPLYGLHAQIIVLAFGEDLGEAAIFPTFAYVTTGK